MSIREKRHWAVEKKWYRASDRLGLGESPGVQQCNPPVLINRGGSCTQSHTVTHSHTHSLVMSSIPLLSETKQILNMSVCVHCGGVMLVTKWAMRDDSSYSIYFDLSSLLGPVVSLLTHSCVLLLVGWCARYLLKVKNKMKYEWSISILYCLKIQWQYLNIMLP